MKMKEVFVVDGNLDIYSVQVPESEWEKGVFTTKIDSQPVIVRCGGWDKITTYAGFATRKEAEKFKTIVTEMEEKEAMKEKKIKEQAKK